MLENQPKIVTIDGPSGAGKGTLAGLLAENLGWNILDSGAIYRLHAYKAMKVGLKLDNLSALVKLAEQLNIYFEIADNYTVQAYLDGRDVTAKIRTEEIGAAASKTAAYPEVRAALLNRQRAFATSSNVSGLIADGRDMGSVVFPKAHLKIYLDASCVIRAKRRRKQLQQAGHDVKFAQLLEEVIARDQRDKSRSHSPLVIPEGAVVINTDELSPGTVFEKIMLLIRQLPEYRN